jgi:hypothetical protein
VTKAKEEEKKKTNKSTACRTVYRSEQDKKLGDGTSMASEGGIEKKASG